MAMTAEAIIFAINSAIRLGRNAQRAYAKSLTSRSIVLPLPAFSGTPNSFTAQRFFDDTDEQLGGAQYIQRMEKLADIHHRFKNASGAAFPSDDELARFGASSKTQTGWAFLEQLHDLGHKAADSWLKENRKHLGKRSTFALPEAFTS